jgi:hypothetical protein
LPAAARGFRTVPAGDLAHLLDHGVSGQTRFQNNTASPLSYGVLDGFDVPMSVVHVFDRPANRSARSSSSPMATSSRGRRLGLPRGKRRSPRSSASIPRRWTLTRPSRARIGRMRTDDRTVVIVHP